MDIELDRKSRMNLSHNQVALLEALLEFPDTTAPSIKDWILKAMPIASRWRPGRTWSTMVASVGNFDWSLAKSTRNGSRKEVTLTERGWAILEGKVVVRVIGFGRYRPKLARHLGPLGVVVSG